MPGDKPLAGLNILVTRPEHQAEKLVGLIGQSGGIALRFPALAIEADHDPEQVRQQIGDIHDYDIAIFISTNAVSNGVGFLPGEGPKPLVAAIGPSTARALSEAGVECDIRAASGFTSEALLREPQLETPEGKRIVIFRGVGGRAHLGAELERRGARVTYAEVYRRDRPPAMDENIASMLADGDIHAVTATSTETLVNLYELATGETLRGLLGAQLVTASQRVVKKAAALGFTSPALLAPTPDDRALVQTLINWRINQTTPTDNSMTQQAEAAPVPAKAKHSEAAEPDLQPDPDQPDDALAERSRGSGPVLSLLAILISLAALTATAWLWWQMREDSQGAMAATADTRSRYDALRQELAELDGKLDQTSSRTSQLLGNAGRFDGRIEDLGNGLETLTARMQRVEESVDDVRGVSATARDKWIRAETEYFLQAANSRLQLARDPVAALAALEAADDRLKSLGDPSLFSVRQQLAAEIESLRSVPQPDIEGIAHTLNSLAQRVDELPLQNSEPGPYTGGGHQVEGETAIQRARSAVLGAFSDMISIKRTDAEVTPLLSRDEEFFLRRNLELQLQTARLALLRGDAANYRESLRTARNWMQSHFLLQDPAVTGAIETLTSLEAEQIAPELPDISASLRLLRLSAPAADGDA